MKTLLLAFLTFLAINLYATEGLHAKGHQVPVILNGGEHLLVGKSRDGKIQIEDGAMFKALSSDAVTVYENWDYNEHITFSPNPYPGGGSEFYVLNIDRGEFIHADLFSEPVAKHEYTQRIRHIDPCDGEIVLWRNHDKDTEQNWYIEKKDLEHLSMWEYDDRVIIGMNSNWFARFFSDCKFVLINCDKHRQTKYIRIRPYQN
jgi:hypothetical protein